MKNLIITILFAFSGMHVMAQMAVQTGLSSMSLDTNMVVYDEQGKALRYYQYAKLVGSGDYIIRGTGTPGSPGSKTILVKMSDELKAQMYEMVKPMITIKAGALREGSVLDVKPMLKALKDETLDKKAALLIFWSVNCPPCTAVFGNFNDYFKEINDPDLVTIAITNDGKRDAADQLKKTPLNATYLLNDASRISGAYGIYEYPVYVLADKDHTIKFAMRGGSPVVMPALIKAIKEVLAK